VPDPHLLIYGSTGYTGRLIVAEALRRGLRPVLAGRSREKLVAQAGETGLDHRVFDVAAPDLNGVRVLLHCAGPFIHTAAPMVDACLAAGVHYLDITGEIPVFEAIAARDAQARERGVMLLPGAGYDVVPSDCLAAHVAARCPGATSLTLAMCQHGGLSHGTATTMLTHLSEGGAVRRGGRIVPLPMGGDPIVVDFGDKRRSVAPIPWGDVSTAWYSTGIPDITVYARLPGAGLPPWMTRAGTAMLGWGPVKGLVQRRIDAAPPGPDETTRRDGWARIWAQATAPDGRTATARLLTPEGYTLTAATAVDLAARALDAAPAGFQTPSRWLGPDYVLGFGCTREVV
jgi:short subunit dehydrogenase-like uncharacterized protein